MLKSNNRARPTGPVASQRRFSAGTSRNLGLLYFGCEKFRGERASC